MHWTPPTSMYNPYMGLLWLIMLLSTILSCKGFLVLFHINSGKNNFFPKHTEQPLSMWAHNLYLLYPSEHTFIGIWMQLDFVWVAS